MKLQIYDVGGDVVKNDQTYLLKDNKTLKNLVLSSTELKSGKSTRGHSHAGQEEVYYFVSGTGEMELGEQRLSVQGGDVILIEDGVFHRVHNTSQAHPLYFVCVFDGKRNH
jgi:mannose-6-phosphate isomerase-like protein (cupin superfamily)